MNLCINNDHFVNIVSRTLAVAIITSLNGTRIKHPTWVISDKIDCLYLFAATQAGSNTINPRQSWNNILDYWEKKTQTENQQLFDWMIDVALFDGVERLS